jgi:fucose permease
LGVRRAKPLSPPSASSECADSPPFIQGLCRLFRTPIFYVQMATFGFAFALQWSFFITADKMLSQLGYKDKVTSYLMALSAISGCVASILIGMFVDRTKRFKEVIKTCYICVSIVAISINLVNSSVKLC